MQDTSMSRALQPGCRLFTSFVIAALTLLLSPWLASGPRTVLAWNTGVTVLLGLIAIMMWRTDAQNTLTRARHEETSNVVILFVTILAVAGALVAIDFGLPKTKGASATLLVFEACECVIGVFLAWLLLHTMYSLHYAKLYYSKINDTDANAIGKGLVFPGDKDLVDYWDFVYYAFTIGMCFQTSDVTVTSPYMRRLTIFHAIVAYLFALAILGLLLDGFIANI